MNMIVGYVFSVEIMVECGRMGEIEYFCRR